MGLVSLERFKINKQNKTKMKEIEGKERLNLQNIAPDFIYPSICQWHGFDWVPLRFPERYTCLDFKNNNT